MLGFRSQLTIIALLFMAGAALLHFIPGGLDCTADRRYSLAPEARHFLQNLTQPVTLRYYYSAHGKMPLPFQDHHERISDLLEKICTASRGKITLQHLDPQPDTDAEASAKLDNIPPITDETTDDNYIGLAVQCIDQKATLPVLMPAQETTLEYDILSTLYRVANFQRKKIGIHSTLPLFGIREKFSEAPFIYKLRERYDIIEVGTTGTGIDGLDLLIVMHPQHPGPAFDTQVRAHLKKGGALMALMDPVSVSWLMYQLPLTKENMNSHWPLLAEVTGLHFTSDQAVLDMRYRDTFDRGHGPEELNYLLSVDNTGCHPHHPITAHLHTLKLLIAGTYRGTPNPGLIPTELVRSTADSMLYQDTAKLADDSKELGQELLRTFQPDPHIYALSILLQSPAATTHCGPGAHIFLTSDADFISGPVPGTMQTERGRPTFTPSPSNDNMAFFMNAVDQLCHTTMLSALRAKTLITRPLTKIQDIQRTAEQAYATQIRHLTDLEHQTSQEIETLNQTLARSGKSDPSLLHDQRTKLTTLADSRAATARQLRTILRQQNHAVTAVETKFKWLNIALAPTLIALLACYLPWHRSRATSRSPIP